MTYIRKNTLILYIRLPFLNLVRIYPDWPIVTRQLIYKTVIGPGFISLIPVSPP